ncbi:MAG: hypothetical protein HQK77_07845 [Desulfobacterales bacterium]|nr:hypothetical protein [Desulfobacterales bacterium]
MKNVCLIPKFFIRSNIFPFNGNLETVIKLHKKIRGTEVLKEENKEIK